MKKIVKSVCFLATFLMAFTLLFSCGKDGDNAKVTFRKANIAQANMLALAEGPVATRAEGDVKVGPKALYTVSDDGSMVEVSYQVDVEGVDGEVAESIQANLIISPGFVFPVGEGWLWLANCHYDVRGDGQIILRTATRVTPCPPLSIILATHTMNAMAHTT